MRADLVARAPPCAASARAATNATTRPVTHPDASRPGARTPTRRSRRRRSAAAVKASTAGRARPSFRPDSRLSECRISRGTRGFVTTVEDSTGSVGESRAPSRNDSVQPRSVSACVASATSTRGERHRQHELAERQVPGPLEHLRLHLEPVAEQDQDQRHDRERLTNPDRGSRSSTSSPPSPSTKPATTNAAVSERKLRRARPGDERPQHEQHAEDRERRLEGVDHGERAAARRHSVRRRRRFSYPDAPDAPRSHAVLTGVLARGLRRARRRARGAAARAYRCRRAGRCASTPAAPAPPQPAPPEETAPEGDGAARRPPRRPGRAAQARRADWQADAACRACSTRARSPSLYPGSVRRYRVDFTGPRDPARVPLADRLRERPPQRRPCS